MKYYYEKPKNWVGAGIIYKCKHPLFNTATLFKINNIGLLIIQKHFDKNSKVYWWGPLDPWLAGDIYLNNNFKEFFNKNADIKNSNDLYPIYKVRKVMWELRTKPLRKNYWETFDD